jgi:two-component system, OmpR family, sensor histidine kinase QseC
MNTTGALERRWRGRLAAVLFTVAAVVFGAVYAIGHAERVAAFDRALADDLRTIANITQVYVDGDVYVNVEPEALGVYMAGGDRVFQVWSAADGEMLDRSESLESQGWSLERPRPPLALGDTPRPGRFTLPDGRSLRLLALRMRANWGVDAEALQRSGQTITDQEVELVVGRPERELAASLMPLAGACLLGAVVLPALALFALQLGTRRFDAMIQRLVLQRERERGFLAHAAHELRTPLAELRSLVDLAELEAEAGAPVERVLGQMREVADRMGALLNSLFRLARVQRGHEEAAEPLDLAAMLGASLQGQAEASAQRGLRWQVPDGAVAIDAPPTLLRALLDNLVGNTIAHARAGSAPVASMQPGPAWRLALVNDCDDEASHFGEHLGQGLQIARMYAQAMGLALHTRSAAGRFEVLVQPLV